MRNTLDVLALENFLAVARLGSVSGAARERRVTQPAVSRQVRAVEQAIGTKLFDRQGRSIQLTEAGRALQKHAADIVEQMAMLPDRVTAASHEPVGRVALGVPYSFGEFIIPPVLRRFHTRYPKVQFWIKQGYSGEILELLARGVLDVGLLYGGTRDPNIVLQPLIRNELGLLAPALPRARTSRARSIALAEVASLPLILPSRSHGLRELVEAAAARGGHRLNIAMEVDSIMLAKSLVRAGLGHMLSAYSGAVRELKSGQLRFLPITPGLQWPLSIGTNRTRQPTLASTELIREITASTRIALRRHAWRGELLLAGPIARS
jgi:LysR family nitrogen assimilation transcriptional regulator